MSGLEIHEEVVDGASVLRLSGDLDLATASQLLQRGLRVLGDPQGHGLLLDASGLDFVDSSGLGCWVELRNTARREGRDFAVITASPAVIRVLEITGIGDLLSNSTAAPQQDA